MKGSISFRLESLMHVVAIIAAGGRGRRLGGEPKQLLSIAGRPVLERSVAAFLEHPVVTELVVALPAELADAPPSYLLHTAKPLRIVAGGARRQDSVANAFRATDARADVIVIHDAARPFVSADLIARTIAAAAESGAALAAMRASDTVKRARAWESSSGGAGGCVVAETLRRDEIFLAQTPQAFRRDVLRDALLGGEHGGEATDEAALAERAGHTVRLVDGEISNIKITTREDLPIAEAIARTTEPRSPEAARAGRAGIGYDLHRLVEGRPLILGGVTIPFDRGLAGHSDADAVCHAITDALLGAAAAGDIGRHFPDTDPRWKGASSIDLLRRTTAFIAERGLEIGNVDASIIAERPKLAPYVDAMRATLAEALGVAIDRVSIKGKTNEGVGALGRGEAIAVHAIALLRSR
jgi:2-C-methyl-D-erythritol 4-phosphate cytidylyltransferase/2-C-methyl-D-erythritol 2,4-cyclodiphosphate synthase